MMAYLLKLQSTPMQQFTTTIGDYFYQITIRYVLNGMAFSFSADGVEILTNASTVQNTPIIQPRYIWEKYGNFMFICKENDYPNFEEFEITQFFVFLTVEEMQNIENNKANKSYYATT